MGSEGQKKWGRVGSVRKGGCMSDGGRKDKAVTMVRRKWWRWFCSCYGSDGCAGECDPRGYGDGDRCCVACDGDWWFDWVCYWYVALLLSLLFLCTLFFLLVFASLYSFAPTSPPISSFPIFSRYPLYRRFLALLPSNINSLSSSLVLHSLHLYPLHLHSLPFTYSLPHIPSSLPVP